VADGMVLGAGLDPASQMGPLVSAKQRARVDGFVQGALAQGARLVAGGEAPPAASSIAPPSLPTARPR
jgi:phenylacetaldehyde dehydrogenase